MSSSADKSKALEAALSQIERAFGKGSIMRLGQKDQAVDIEVISTGSLSLDIALGIGGLPAMLASIDRSMTGVRITETEFNGEPCQVFHGRWDQTVLTNYDKAIGNYKTNLAPFFPDKVELTLSKASDLPVRVVYLKNQIDQSGKVAGETPIMSLEFRDYRFEPLPPETFHFQLPSGREEIDQTEEYLGLIKKSDDAFGGKSVAPPAAATP